MKNNVFIRTTLSFLFSVVSVLLISAQDLKTYQGPYKPLNGGQVEYQYRDAPDGSRIFEGDFIFVDDAGYPRKIKGQFKDDRQIGTWLWEYDEVRKVEIVFTENGCSFKCEGLGRTKRSYVKGTIGQLLRNPYDIRSLEIYDAGIGRILRMRWDSNGNQDGPWFVKMDKDSPGYTRNAMGENWHYMDNSTGDEVSQSDIWGLQSAMDNAESWAWENVRPCLMRSTFKRK